MASQEPKCTWKAEAARLSAAADHGAHWKSHSQRLSISYNWLVIQMLHESGLCSNTNLRTGTKSFSKLLATAGLTKIKLQIKCLLVAEQMDSGLFIKRNPLSKESELQPQAPRERKLRHKAGQEVPRQKQANKNIYCMLSTKFTDRQKETIHCLEIEWQT